MFNLNHWFVFREGFSYKSYKQISGNRDDMENVRVSVYSPPLIRRRNGPSDDYSQLTNSRKDLSSAVEDMKKSNFSQDTAPETITATMTNSDALQSSERYVSKYFICVYIFYVFCINFFNFNFYVCACMHASKRVCVFVYVHIRMCATVQNSRLH